MAPMASTLFFFPTIFKIKFAIVSAAPVFSRIVPIIVPHRITMPILVIMLPKPDFTVLTTSSGSIPQMRPTAIAMTVRTMNGCRWNLEIAITITITDKMISAKRKNVCIMCCLLFCLLMIQLDSLNQ